jgi:hypothetical protein
MWHLSFSWRYFGLFVLVGDKLAPDQVRRLGIVVLTFLSLLGGSIAPDAMADSAVKPSAVKPSPVKPTAVEAQPALVRSLLARYQRLKAVSLTYVQVSEDGSALETGFRRRVAASTPGAFFRDNAHWAGRLAWEDDPLRKQLLVTAVRSVSYGPADRAFFELQGLPNELLNLVRDEFLVHALVWWPFEKESPPDLLGIPWTADSLFAKHRCTIRKGSQTEDGLSVRVVDVEGVGTFWIAPELGPAIVSWVAYQPGTSIEVERIELGGWRRCHDDIWMPSRMRNIQYDFRASTPALRRSKVADAFFRIEDVQVNDEVPEQFRFDIPAGAVRTMAKNGRSEVAEVYPDESDFAATLLNWMRRIRNEPDGEPPKSQRLLYIGLGALVGIALSWISVVALKRRRPVGALSSPMSVRSSGAGPVPTSD